ncbi:MAG TPA: MBL fold metallo-hydrolase [Terrimicrobiaceae bacterium]
MLVNASPDLPIQIDRYLRASEANSIRFSPVSEVFLTGADLDHVLGLFLIRENRSGLRISASPDVRRVLCDDLRLERTLNGFCGVAWRDMEDWSVESSAGMAVSRIPLPTEKAPLYAPTENLPTAGYIFRDTKSGRKAGIFPDVAQINDELLHVVGQCDILLFDGTFWSNEELKVLGVSERSAIDMGHIPISGKDGSLERLTGLKIPFCAYVHINNTNPLLRPNSVERAEIERGGLFLASDGLRMVL